MIVSLKVVINASIIIQALYTVSLKYNRYNIDVKIHLPCFNILKTKKRFGKRLTSFDILIYYKLPHQRARTF